jgi:hypothetical protein
MGCTIAASVGDRARAEARNAADGTGRRDCAHGVPASASAEGCGIGNGAHLAVVPDAWARQAGCEDLASWPTTTKAAFTVSAGQRPSDKL